MPELPEVETIRRSLRPHLEGRTLVSVCMSEDPRYVRLDEALERPVKSLGRRGKYLVMDLGDRELIIHLGMTGRLGVNEARAVPQRHLRVAFGLDDARVLYLCDARRFGKMHVVVPGAYIELPTLAAMGPEPLSDAFEPAAFVVAMAKATRVKPLLLSQRVVAGLGNIYVDEALHLAGIHPDRGRLSRAEALRLHGAIREVLGAAVTHRGTTFRDYVDADGNRGENQFHLRVYDREGEPCAICGTPIKKVVLQQRGTHFCPCCQPIRRRR